MIQCLCRRPPASLGESYYNLWIESGHPAKSLRRVFATVLPTYHFQIQLFFFRNQVSIEVALLFIIGYGKPTYSRLTVRIRIALRSITRQFRSTTSSTGCTLPSILKQIELFIRGCFRRVRFRLHENFSSK